MLSAPRGTLSPLSVLKTEDLQFLSTVPLSSSPLPRHPAPALRYSPHVLPDPSRPLPASPQCRFTPQSHRPSRTHQSRLWRRPATLRHPRKRPPHRRAFPLPRLHRLDRLRLFVNGKNSGKGTPRTPRHHPRLSLYRSRWPASHLRSRRPSGPLRPSRPPPPSPSHPVAHPFNGEAFPTHPKSVIPPRPLYDKLSSRPERPDFLFRAIFWRLGPRSGGIPPLLFSSLFYSLCPLCSYLCELCVTVPLSCLSLPRCFLARRAA